MFEINIVEISIYILTGAFAGFSAGLLGIGGGLIIVPVLYFTFSMHGYPTQYLMHMALATSLATIIITSISSTLAHHKKKAVFWQLVLLLTPGIGLGAWLGANFAASLDTAILKPIFGIFEIFVALLMFSDYQSKQHELTINTTSGLVGGSFIGGVSALVGIGGGTLTVPFLHWHRINIKNAIATSAACGLPIAVFATSSYIFAGTTILDAGQLNQPGMLGFVQLHAFVLIAATSFLTAPFGAKLAHRISDRLLKKIFALFLLALGVKILFF